MTVFLDTHVVVWLYSGLINKISTNAAKQIEDNEVMISQMVRLELQYLFEIGRITTSADEMIDELKQLIGLTVSNSTPNEIFSNAIQQSWTRDVFDRLIVAEASVQNKILLSKDRRIRDHYSKTIW